MELNWNDYIKDRARNFDGEFIDGVNKIELEEVGLQLDQRYVGTEPRCAEAGK